MRSSSHGRSGSLTVGTDLDFSPLGAVGLRGLPGEWELFVASAGRDS